MQTNNGTEATAVNFCKGKIAVAQPAGCGRQISLRENLPSHGLRAMSGNFS
jgi:hypothetical protein